MERKHILIIVPSFDIGGAQKIGSFIAGNLSRDGSEVSLIGLERGDNLLKVDPSVGQYSFKNYDVYNTSKIKKIGYAIKLRMLIKKLKPDAVIIFGTLVVAYLAVLGLRMPIMGCERGDPNSYNRKLRSRVVRAYKRFSILTFQTPMARDGYPELADKKSYVIPNPCFLADSDNEVTEINRKKEVVSVGRLVEEKGYEMLIRAFVSIHHLHPEYKLIIYGDGPQKELLANLIAENEASEYVFLPGKTDKVKQNIQNASLFVLSSDYEGIPNTLLEAMCLGVPVVTTDCSPGGARFLTKDGSIGGLLIPVRDEKKMADAIDKMLSDRCFAEEMAKKGLSVNADYSPETIYRLWKQAINVLICI